MSPEAEISADYRLGLLLGPGFSVDLEAGTVRVHSLVDLRRALEILRFDPGWACTVLFDLSAREEPDGRHVELVYRLESSVTGIDIAVRARSARELPPEGRGEPPRPPTIPTASDLWPAALLLERELAESFGFLVTAHPDPRRLTVPEDWPGAPLRRDAELPELYHGVRFSRTPKAAKAP